jgi:hypothetical protein|tara:strand:+ start:1077 stop:1295 length:219 start_codon:yes stop_codon:yes gene_type:complete
LEAHKVFLVLLCDIFYFCGDIMISWLNVVLEKCQDYLTRAKAWLDAERSVKNRTVVLLSSLAVVAVLVLVAI